MAGCGCNKQSGGGSKRCSCKKCRRYSQRGGGLFDFFGSEKPKEDSTVSKITPSSSEKKVCITEEEYNKLLAKSEQELPSVSPLPSEVVAPTRGGGGGGNMMARQNYPGHHGGYGELVTAQDEAIIGLDSGPSIATQGISTLQGGKRRTRKIRKTRRMKKSRKHMKSRKYRR
jgi:hypothetical protein